MKIGHSADKAAALAAAQAPTATPSGASATGTRAIPAQADPSAKIQLSSGVAGLLSGHSHGDFDAAKVDRISKAIAAGTFKPDAGRIADKLLASAHELMQRAQS